MASLDIGNGRGRSLVVLSAVLQLVTHSSLASKGNSTLSKTQGRGDLNQREVDLFPFDAHIFSARRSCSPHWPWMGVGDRVSHRWVRNLGVGLRHGAPDPATPEKGPTTARR